MPTLFLGGKARLPLSGSSDEDPYSLTRSGSSDNSSGKNKREMEKNKKQLLGPKNWVFNNERNWSATQDRKRDRCWKEALTWKRSFRITFFQITG